MLTAGMDRMVCTDMLGRGRVNKTKAFFVAVQTPSSQHEGRGSNWRLRGKEERRKKPVTGIGDDVIFIFWDDLG